MKRPVSVTPFTRHRKSCSSADRGEFFPRCDCPKFLRYFMNGHLHRLPAHTRAWNIAEEKAAELQAQLQKGNPILVRVETDTPTIEQAVDTFISGKESEGLSKPTLRKLRFQLAQFERFMTQRHKFFPSEVTATDVIEYRASWDSWKSGVTRQKAQQNLRGFLRFACTKNLPELLAALKPVRLSRIDKERLQPQPFTEKELTTLLAQVPVTFPDAKKAARITALIHCQVATGLVIRDSVQLERANIKDGWLRIERQKTDKKVRQKLDAALCEELLSVARERFIFWDEKSEITSAVGLYQTDLRQLMKDADLWVKGNLSHRFRDTAVDFWLGHGCDLTTVAALLGDTTRTVEKHYADLASKRMEERLAKTPLRQWSIHV
jgi:site-specific recombinase XerD